MKKALKLALEALEDIRGDCAGCDFEWNNDYPLQAKAHTAIKEALAQPEQEPVALESVYETIIQWDEFGGKRSRRELARRIVDLYTTPPQRTWVGLTDEEIYEATKDVDKKPLRVIVDLLEAKLKEKNA